MKQMAPIIIMIVNLRTPLLELGHRKRLGFEPTTPLSNDLKVQMCDVIMFLSLEARTASLVQILTSEDTEG